MVDEALDKYVGKQKLEKTLIICELVQRVREASPLGGFVKKDINTGRYYEVGDHFAREKTSQAFRDALHERFKSGDAPKKRQGMGRRSSDPSFTRKKSRSGSPYGEDQSNYQEPYAPQATAPNAHIIQDSQTAPWRKTAGVTKSCPDFSSSGESSLSGESSEHEPNPEENWQWPVSPRPSSVSPTMACGKANGLLGKVMHADENPQGQTTQGNNVETSPVMSYFQPAGTQTLAPIYEGPVVPSIVSVGSNNQGQQVAQNFQPALEQFLQLGMDCKLPFATAHLDTTGFRAGQVAASPPQSVDVRDKEQPDDLFEKLLRLTKDCSTTGNPFDPTPILEPQPL